MSTNPTASAVVIEKAGEAIAFHLSELRAAGEPIPIPTTRTTHIAAR